MGTGGQSHGAFAMGFLFGTATATFQVEGMVTGGGCRSSPWRISAARSTEEAEMVWESGDLERAGQQADGRLDCGSQDGDFVRWHYHVICFVVGGQKSKISDGSEEGLLLLLLGKDCPNVF